MVVLWQSNEPLYMYKNSSLGKTDSYYNLKRIPFLLFQPQYNPVEIDIINYRLD